MKQLKPAWSDIALGATIRFESALFDRVVEQQVVRKTVDDGKRRIHTGTLIVEYDRKDIELVVS